MRILILNPKDDFRLLSLISPLRAFEEIGVMREFDQDSYDQYNPELVFSNDMSKTPGAYDIAKIASLTPFINLDSFKEPEAAPRYNADMSYVGPITDMESSLLDILRLGYNVKNFFGSPSTFPCYSGDISMTECYNVYKNCKVSPIPKNDIGYREMDVIISGGNPLKYKDKEGFIKAAIKGIEGKKFSTKLSKSEILSHHTNYDRLSSELYKFGLTILADKIIDRKKLCSA